MKPGHNYFLMGTLFLNLLVFHIRFGNAETQAVSSVLEDQENVSVTIYNNNLGLVKDTRRITLKSGFTELDLGDVASAIMPQTVHIQSITSPGALNVLEQNYEYDLLSPQTLLAKYVGKEIKVIQNNTEVPLKVLSINNGLVYQIADEIFTEAPGKLIFPSIPDNLISKPTLVLSLENQFTKPQLLEVSYLTAGISWKADYVAVLSKDSHKMDLSGWVTLDNQSGTTYRSAKLKLVAGEVHRATDNQIERASPAAAARPLPLSEQSFSEYHLYSLDRRTTIKDHESKQISLLSEEGIPIKKEYFYFGDTSYYSTQIINRLPKQKVAVYITFSNNKEFNLGFPLPKGIVRVYQADTDNSLQFAGEDNIDHTPRNEKVKLKLGDAFDLVAERKQTDWRRLANNYSESAFEITLKNHKEEDVIINVVEPMYGEFEISEHSLPFEKLGANSIKFQVPVKKDGETILRYRVKVRF